MSELDKISMLTQREIEANIVAPMIKSFIKEFGREKTLEVVKRVVQSLARESGGRLASYLKGNNLADFAEGLKLWAKDGALQIKVLERTETTFSFNVSRCMYAEMYTKLGISELGYILSCSRDFAMIEGFNPKIKLDRKNTIMEGAAYCDFRFSLLRE